MSGQSSIDDGTASSYSLLSTDVDMPSVEQILSGFPEKPISLPTRGEEMLSQEQQKNLLHALQSAIENVQDTTEAGSSFELKELQQLSLEPATDAHLKQRRLQIVRNVHSILGQLWLSNSDLLTEAAETLANGSRDRESVLIFPCETAG